MKNKNRIIKLTNKILEFRKNRNWEKYHSPKNMAISFYCEIAELAEHFQYGDDKYFKIKKYDERVSDELIDVLWWTLLISHEYEIDLNKTKIYKRKNFYPRKSLLKIFGSIGKISLELINSSDKIKIKYIVKNKPSLIKELRTIFNEVILFAEFLNIDIEKEFFRKLKKNKKKYPSNKKGAFLLSVFSGKLTI